MSYSKKAPTLDPIHAYALSEAKTNFFLWMFLAQEGCYEEALEFVQKREEDPTPFDGLLCQILEVRDYTPEIDF